jgi:acyl-coenzyme A thioesterase PaaI-like protein
MSGTTTSTKRGRWQRLLMRLINLYPPYLGAGIRVVRAGPDQRRFEVRMKLAWYNRNLVGTHFGGSLYSMCDPFFMFILVANLGGDYIVWDRAATIRFRRPGRGTVRAVFEIAPERIDQIRRAADTGDKVEPVFTVNVLDEEGGVVAELEKVLYVRRRDRRERLDAGKTTGNSRESEVESREPEVES